MESRPRPASFVAIPDLPTSFRVGDHTVDADTHEGLRAALVQVASRGWDNDAGRAITGALNNRCAGWAYNLVRRGRVHVADPGDVLSCAWVTLHRFGSAVIAAERSWTYLWTSVGNELLCTQASSALLSDRDARHQQAHGPVHVARMGLDPTRAAVAAGWAGSTATADEPPITATVVELLAAGNPRERAYWAEAVDRAIDVMTQARRSYEETTLRQDAYMLDVLGLSLAEVSALAALLIGPRRGDRAAQSLLLALYRDRDADPANVVGAMDRIRFLTSRPHSLARVAMVPTQRTAAAA